MTGGTAKTYMAWKRIGQPYMKNKVYYIKVQKPGALAEKEVRFYTDTEHYELCHDIFTCTPLYKLFDFKDEKDSINIIYQKYLSEDEENKYFKSSNGKWHICRNTKGTFWRSAADTELPPIRNSHCFMIIDWTHFKAEQAKYVEKEFGRNLYWN